VKSEIGMRSSVPVFELAIAKYQSLTPNYEGE